MFERIEVNSERWFDLTPLKNEIWIDIKNYEGLYQISNYGRVKSMERTVKQFNRFKECNKHVSERILKNCYDKDGYLVVGLYKEGSSKWLRVHQLMGYLFLKNDGSLIVNHKDLNKQNPRIDNLELCTDYENKQHAKRNGAVRKGRKLMAFNDNEEILFNDLKSFSIENGISYSMASYYVYKKKEWNGYNFKFLQ